MTQRRATSAALFPFPAGALPDDAVPGGPTPPASRDEAEPPAPAQQISLTFDHRPLRVASGSRLLDVARAAGIDLPSLCDHPPLRPNGACRLCLVEVTDPGRPPRVVAACLYRAREGQVVRSDSPDAQRARAASLQLLMVHSPANPTLLALAERIGVPPLPGLRRQDGSDDCVLCGLCVRVCASYATAAIGSLHRGVRKALGSPPSADAAAECVGCGACVHVCPTGHLRLQRGEDWDRLWGRRFERAVCRVDAARCLGCGACERACPFAVARVAQRRGEGPQAVIDPLRCRGCGLCLPACPSGAIEQQGVAESALQVALGRPWPSAPAPRSVTYHCPRAPLGHQPPTRALQLPCSGRVTLASLLQPLLEGAQLVSVLAREPETCPNAPGCTRAEERVEQARALLSLLGHDAARVVAARPAAGLEEPRRWVDAQSRALAASAAAPSQGLRAATADLPQAPLARSFALAQRLGAQQRWAGLATWAAPWCPPSPEGATPLALSLGELPLLDLLLAPQTQPWRPAEVLRAAAHLGARLGRGLELHAGQESGAPWTLDAGRDGARRPFGVWLAQNLSRLLAEGPPLQLAVWEDLPPSDDFLSALGERRQLSYRRLAGWSPGGDGALPERALDPSPSALRALAETFQEAERAGVAAIVCEDLGRLCLARSLQREGAWRRSRLLALSPAELLLALEATP